MKHFVLAFALLTISVSVFAKPPPEFIQYREECATELGITKPPHHGGGNGGDPQVKCFNACIMKKIGSLVDGKISLEKELENITKIIPNPDDSTKAKITECINKANTESDKCEVAYSMKKCMKDNDVFPRHHGRPKQD